MCIVVNKYKEPFDVCIQRGTRWGNPYKAEEVGLEEALRLYRKHLWRQIKRNAITLEQLRFLYGKRLGCTCKPRACHGDILVKAVEWAWKQGS